MDNVRLGFVGAGFVGGAMIRAFSGYFPCIVYDKDKKIGSLKEVVGESDVIFLSLPTPEGEYGQCDTTILDSVLREINEMCVTVRCPGDPTPLPIVVRSTVTPTWFYEASERNEHLEIFYMPEFLTARTADLDFIMSSRFILGTDDPDCPSLSARMIDEVFEARFPRTPFKIMTWEEASLVKYATNCFFTVKISFFNELYEICNSLAVDGKKVIEEVMNDGRIGRSHFKVPGPDGSFGWGGACFPKDSSEWENGFGVDASDMVSAARKVNERVRRDDYGR